MIGKVKGREPHKALSIDLTLQFHRYQIPGVSAVTLSHSLSLLPVPYLLSTTTADILYLQSLDLLQRKQTETYKLSAFTLNINFSLIFLDFWLLLLDIAA